MPRYFTVASAGRLLSQIAPPLEEASSLGKLYAEAEQELRTAAERLSMIGGAMPDRPKLLGMIGRRDTLATRMNEAVASIQEHGCVVKDLALGLVDFPTLLRGEEVYLCWKLGEAAIGYWHGMEEGFRGRKPIDLEFLANHSGDDSAEG
jgi:hypothetical protein